MSEVGRLCGHVNDNRLRAVVADGDLLLSPTVARRRGGGIARGGRACGTCSACGGASGIRCALGRRGKQGPAENGVQSNPEKTAAEGGANE